MSVERWREKKALTINLFCTRSLKGNISKIAGEICWEASHLRTGSFVKNSQILEILTKCKVCNVAKNTIRIKWIGSANNFTKIEAIIHLLVQISRLNRCNRGLFNLHIKTNYSISNCGNTRSNGIFLFSAIRLPKVSFKIGY